MGAAGPTAEQLKEYSYKELLGIIGDFLGWGGSAQAEKARLAHGELACRIEQRERAVGKDEKVLAVI